MLPSSQGLIRNLAADLRRMDRLHLVHTCSRHKDSADPDFAYYFLTAIFYFVSSCHPQQHDIIAQEKSRLERLERQHKQTGQQMKVSSSGSDEQKTLMIQYRNEQDELESQRRILDDLEFQLLEVCANLHTLLLILLFCCLAFDGNLVDYSITVILITSCINEVKEEYDQEIPFHL